MQVEPLGGRIFDAHTTYDRLFFLHHLRPRSHSLVDVRGYTQPITTETYNLRNVTVSRVGNYTYGEFVRFLSTGDPDDHNITIGPTGLIFAGHPNRTYDNVSTACSSSFLFPALHPTISM